MFLFKAGALAILGMFNTSVNASSYRTNCCEHAVYFAV